MNGRLTMGPDWMNYQGGKQREIEADPPRIPEDKTMDRLAAAVLIAIAALVMSHGFGGGVLAAEAALRLEPVSRPVLAAEPQPQPPVSRSSRVLSLVIALEALRLNEVSLARQ